MPPGCLPQGHHGKVLDCDNKRPSKTAPDRPRSYPAVFSRLAALSPSVWWDNRAVIRDFARLRKKTAVRLWLDTGTAEPGWEAGQILRDTLVGRGWKLGDDLRYLEVAGAGHTETAWAARIGDVLQWIVGRPPRRSHRMAQM